MAQGARWPLVNVNLAVAFNIIHSFKLDDND